MKIPKFLIMIALMLLTGALLFAIIFSLFFSSFLPKTETKGVIYKKQEQKN
jgi:hypothetical protein